MLTSFNHPSQPLQHHHSNNGNGSRQLLLLNSSSSSGCGGNTFVIGGGGLGDIHQVTLWADREHKMLDKVFANLQVLKKVDGSVTASSSPFPYHIHVQARLDFLTAVFSSVGSPDDFRYFL